MNSMKLSTHFVIALACVVGLAKAQPPGGNRVNTVRPSPLEEVLDTDRDGTVSAVEIANAAVALKSLDVDRDGKLSSDEIRSLLPSSDEAGSQGGGSQGRGPGAAGGGRGAPGGPAGSPGVRGRVLDPVVRIMQADADNDGKLSGDEIPVHMKRGLSRIDENGNGVVEREEIESMIQILGLVRPNNAGRDGQTPGKDSGRPSRPNRAR